jgi:multidrug resistance efflux pump
MISINFFRSAKERAEADLVNAELDLLAAEAKLEQYEAQALMLKARIERLKEHLGYDRPVPMEVGQ